MWRYALRRLGYAVPILIGVSIVVFALIKMAPGDAADLLIPPETPLALSCRPSILLADEPTTALDVTVQIQIILLLRRLQRELGMAVIFVTHDVGVSVEIADRLAVMYAGRFVETGPTEAVIRQPRHPYTEGLLGSTVTTARGQRLPAIPGAPPDLRALPPGCAFAPRCRYAEERCTADVPPQHHVAPDHTTRCVRAQEAEKGPSASLAPSAARST